MSDAKTPSRKRSPKTPAGSKTKKAAGSDAGEAGNTVAEKNPAGSSKAMSPAPSYEDVADLAYQKFEEHGYQHGRDVDDWVEAERELLETHAGRGKRSTPKR